MSVDSTTDSESPKCLSPTPTTQEASETPGAHFTTYGEYLEANRHLFHAFSLPAAPPRNLYLGEDMPHDQDHRLSGHICAIDIASDGSISCMDLEPTGNLVGSVIVNNPCQKSYREQVRCVSAELRTRIVIADRVLNPFFLASFGLEYEFDPEIVLAYLESDGMTSSSKLEYYHMSQIPPVKVPLQSCSKSRKKVLDLGYGRFAFSKKVRNKRERNHIFNVIFIFWPYFAPTQSRNKHFVHPSYMSSIFAHHFPLNIPAYSGRYSQAFKYKLATGFLREIYIASLKSWPLRDRTHECPDWRIFLAPLIDVKVVELYVSALFIETYRFEKPDQMYEAWSFLRIDLETTVSTQSSWRRIFDEPTNNAPPFLIDHPFAMEFARRVEVLIRDEQQLQVGKLSLQESKKAIEQANISIQEGKRMKMLTILAFFFVPASLSTSVFGMNLRELGSPPVWVFVVTTLAIFGGAFALWASVYQFNLAIHAPSAGREGMSFKDRLKTLGWLVGKFHLIFLFRSGIWLSLFTDGEFGFLPSCEFPDCPPEDHDPNRPCFYVQQHRRRYMDYGARYDSGFRGITPNHGNKT